MFFLVYRMRQGGARIAGADPQLREPARGWLEFKRSPLDSYGARWEAHLLDRQGGRDVIPPMRYARLHRVDGVMHLVGQEEGGRKNVKATSRPWKQSWLCALDEADALPLLERVHVTCTTGFSAEGDFADDDPFNPLED